MSDTGAFMEDDSPTVKKRRVRKDDWEKVGKFITDELKKRENSQFRKSHETKWREVDRQIRMEEMKRLTAAGQEMPVTWNAVFELGELSKASEIICADVRRITFPQDRFWLEAHVEIPKQITEQGTLPPDGKMQVEADGTMRSFLTQQHLDFGFKARVDLSIKEALHHGSFVAEVEYQEQMMVWEGSKLQLVGSPVWVAHSMWNCYPDESPSVQPTSLFYTGSMIIRKFMPLYQVKRLKGEGYMPAQYSKIKKQENRNGEIDTQDVELVVYYGDINIERGDGDIYLPNSKAITANGTIIYYAPNELPFPSIIFGGYERQDPRDPYHTSPLIKQSPIQKVATICMNKFIDGVSLKTEPPIVYDGNDPQFVADGGPRIEPGVKTPSKNGADFKVIEVGDPMAALEGAQMALRQLQEGTGVSAVRSGIANSDRQTATEVQKVAQGSEVRTIDFIDKLDTHLRSYLYMQHQLNKKHCTRYSFYNNEMGTPDFVRITKKDIPDNVHFDVVGSKGILGEEQRASRTAGVVQFAASTPGFAERLDTDAILVEMLKDAGNKNPERLLKPQEQQPQIPPQVIQKFQEMQQTLLQCQQELKQTQLKLADKSQDQQIKGAVAQQGMQQDNEAHRQELAMNAQKHNQEMQEDRAQFQQDLEQQLASFRQNLELDRKLAEAKETT